MHTERSLAVSARNQAGAFSRRQAFAAGFTRRQIEHRLDQQVWRSLLPSVYAYSSTAHAPEQTMWAALLWAGDGALLSHRTAGHCWGYDDVRMRRPVVLVPASSAKRSKLVIARRTRGLTVHDRRFVRGLAVTSPERTLLDLASVLDEEALEIAFESARRERLVTIASVQRCLDRNGTHGRRGTALLRGLLRALADVPSESALEVKAARLLRRSKLPRPVQQLPVGRFRLDFAWPDRRVALECDGRLRHSEVADFQRDRTKLTALAAAGWRVLVVTRDDVVHRPDEMISRVDAALSLAVASLPVRRRGRRSTS